MNDVIAFVQFIHPGKESNSSRRRDSCVIPWNRSIHRRKFLCQPGWYVESQHTPSQVSLSTRVVYG